MWILKWVFCPECAKDKCESEILDNRTCERCSHIESPDRFFSSEMMRIWGEYNERANKYIATHILCPYYPHFWCEDKAMEEIKDLIKKLKKYNFNY